MITDDEIKAARALCEGWKGRFIVHVEHDPEDHYEYLSIGFVDSDGNETLELDAPRDLCAPLVDLLNAPLTLVPRMLAEVERLRAALAEAVELAGEAIAQHGADDYFTVKNQWAERLAALKAKVAP